MTTASFVGGGSLQFAQKDLGDNYGAFFESAEGEIYVAHIITLNSDESVQHILYKLHVDG